MTTDPTPAATAEARATETDRKDGWWVTPEWRDNDLYLGTIKIGRAFAHTSGAGRWYRCDRWPIVNDAADLQSAQAALLAAVRPQEEDV